jgi:hypothetical protein
MENCVVHTLRTFSGVGELAQVLVVSWVKYASNSHGKLRQAKEK